MNRYAFNNNATAAAATMPAPIANRLVNVSRESLLDILLRPFRRGQISRELRLLDPRMLSDIGVSPSEIDRIAAESVGGKGEWIVLSLLRLTGRKIADWANKRATYRSLMSLDERMLSDIGLTRGDIPALIDAMRGPLARPVSGLETEVILPLKQWNLWRLAHKQLNQLDNRMLSDIGFVRGDIDRIADELAARTVTKAANANANSVAPRAA
ncbi:MAG TPA: DUF1127 domain-containing protein [Dongiaceae bacterium]